jgi:hypothetical protein
MLGGGGSKENGVNVDRGEHVASVSVVTKSQCRVLLVIRIEIISIN